MGQATQKHNPYDYGAELRLDGLCVQTPVHKTLALHLVLLCHIIMWRTATALIYVRRMFLERPQPCPGYVLDMNRQIDPSPGQEDVVRNTGSGSREASVKGVLWTSSL
uniref:Uncharacterized protein n=1 Tax=Coccidioides posadasii RMSCC 3488 TaxID=454284 RepID=A0A0J6FD92_COCPO|nr:hypothetical protein CPAG_03575 [Coccidioides posadasii RMSCC 3488]